MAVNEGIRKTGEAFVVSMCPDVCLTPMGPKDVPVPYDILAFFDQSMNTKPRVLIRGKETFTTNSWIQGVIGNEAGTAGGISTGVFSKGGVCQAVPGTETQFVTAQKELIVYHTTTMQMNAPAPQAPGNTKGRAVFQAGSSTVTVDPNGKVKGNTNPKDKPENEEEVKARSEMKREYQSDRRQYGSDVKPDQRNPGPVDKGHETSVKFEQKKFEESVWKTDDGSIKVGTYSGTNTYGAGYNHATNTYNAGIGTSRQFTTLSTTTGQMTSADGVLTGKIDAELLSAKGEIGAQFTAGPGKVALEGKAGVEAIVAQATGSAGVRITGKTLWDHYVGKTIKALPESDIKKKLMPYAEAPKSVDKGIEIGVTGNIGVGGAAEISGKVGYDKNAPEGQAKFGATWGAKLGLGPMAGIKSYFGLIF
jgi:hypothetical protein